MRNPILALLLAALALSLTVESVSACWKCRRRYYRPTAPQVITNTETIREERIIETPKQVLQIQNVYPAGNTQYTVGEAAQVYAVNPDAAIAAAARIADNAIDGLGTSIASGLELSDDIAEIAKIQAATEQLRTALEAGQDDGPLVRNTTNIDTFQNPPAPGGGGGGAQTRDDIRSRPFGTTSSDAARTAAGGSLVAQLCARCHGGGLSEPAEGLVFDPAVRITSDNLKRAVNAVQSGRMPKGDPLENPADRLAVIVELIGLTNGGSNE